jgi:cytochrome P450
MDDMSLATRFPQELLVTPKPGTFFPWSAGPQNCPGEKFAEVEFVAVIACLLRDHRIGIVPNGPGESFPAARTRVLDTTQDCDLKLLLRMRNADQVRLECKPA